MVKFKDSEFESISEDKLSKLKKVYKIGYHKDTNKLTCESYPIIYMNEDYTYVKVSGSKLLNLIRNDMAYLHYCDNLEKVIISILSTGLNYIEKFCYDDPREELKRLNQNINKYTHDNKIENINKSLKLKKAQLTMIQKEIENLNREKSKLQGEDNGEEIN